MRFAFAALFAVLAFAANAQIIPSALTGRVTAGDAPAAGVTVTATSRARELTRTATTGAQGTYWIDVLEPGTYDVSFSRAGLTSLSRPAIVELGRIARADARLDASDDEETVTSTARTVSVAEWAWMTTRFTGEELDRLPRGRQAYAAEELAPGFVRRIPAVMDGGLFGPQGVTGEEILDEATVFRGNLPIEADYLPAGITVARTRSGSDGFFLALRDSISEGPEHFFETASGGRIGGAPLWFFAAGWSGDAADRGLENLAGLELKLEAQAGNAHAFMAMHLDGAAEYPEVDPAAAASVLRYTGVLSERFTAEALVARDHVEIFGIEDDSTYAATRFAYVLPSSSGDHVLAAGLSRHDALEGWSAFVGDRWSAGRWFIDAGLRWAQDVFDHELEPRLAVTFDLRGNGRHAVIASHGHYAYEDARLTTLGYAIAIGSSGSARADVLRREYEAGDIDQIQLDARYRLFDRLDLGANYTWSDRQIFDSEFPPTLEQIAHAWTGIELPVGDHVFGATFLQRFYTFEGDDHAPSDIALRYSVPVRRTVVTVAADVLNAFEAEPGPLDRRREARIHFSVRLSTGN